MKLKLSLSSRQIGHVQSVDSEVVAGDVVSGCPDVDAIDPIGEQGGKTNWGMFGDSSTSFMLHFVDNIIKVIKHTG